MSVKYTYTNTPSQTGKCMVVTHFAAVRCWRWAAYQESVWLSLISTTPPVPEGQINTLSRSNISTSLPYTSLIHYLRINSSLPNTSTSLPYTSTLHYWTHLLYYYTHQHFTTKHIHFTTIHINSSLLKTSASLPQTYVSLSLIHHTRFPQLHWGYQTHPFHCLSFFRCRTISDFHNPTRVRGANKYRLYDQALLHFWIYLFLGWGGGGWGGRVCREGKEGKEKGGKRVIQRLQNSNAR